LSIIAHIVIVLICFVALWLGAQWLVDSSVRLAKRLGLSEIVIGLTVVALGTSAPEFAVTIGAALRGHESISIANVVGSNIFNIGFILGGCAVVGIINTKPTLVWRDGLLLLAVTFGLSLMLQDGRLARWEGILLAALLLGYLGYLFVQREPLDEEIPTGRATWRDGPMLLGGLVLIVGGGHFLVESSVKLAQAVGLSNWVIGMTVIAAGTSLPEFVVSLVAVLKKHHGISAGNLIGSNIFNTLGVLGTAGAIRPLTVDDSAMASLLMLIGITALVLLFMRTNWRLTRNEGAILILASAAAWGYNLLAGN